jgi:hypothetical protein
MMHPTERYGDPADAQSHNHVFLGEAHEKNEHKTWAQ